METSNSPTNAFDSELKAIVIGEENPTHIGDIVLQNFLSYDQEKGQKAVGLIRQIATNGIAPRSISLGLKAHYEATAGTNNINLRFIDPDNPQLSKTGVIIRFRHGHGFNNDQIKAMMDSFIRPDELDAKPALEKKGPEQPKRP